MKFICRSDGGGGRGGDTSSPSILLKESKIMPKIKFILKLYSFFKNINVSFLW